ncbi:MAG: acyl transferase [Bacteroidota bacterium]|nr:acyl transferase [Bacteroidota bacterium]
MGFELPKAKSLAKRVFNLNNEKDFLQIALDIFQHQYLTSAVYKAYCEAIKANPQQVKRIDQIPFLPIQFFKNFEVTAGLFHPQVVFKSSGTSGEKTSHHHLKEVAVYETSFLNCFKIFYGNPEGACILGLLPSYLEKGDSSLVYMVDCLIKKSGHRLSGFYLYEHQKLKETLLQAEAAGERTILFGVSYALLDFAEAFPMPLQNTTIIETGGMKGRKKEITKDALYHQLKAAFSMNEIHSEYGMTELLSQAYGVNGLYRTPPWMKVLLREETDPFSFSSSTGVINVIDLANFNSCSFIATDDRGRLHKDERFEILGRLDNSDIRGCSQLVIV